jgi:hypothetical protein
MNDFTAIARNTKSVTAITVRTIAASGRSTVSPAIICTTFGMPITDPANPTSPTTAAACIACFRNRGLSASAPRSAIGNPTKAGMSAVTLTMPVPKYATTPRTMSPRPNPIDAFAIAGTLGSRDPGVDRESRSFCFGTRPAILRVRVGRRVSIQAIFRGVSRAALAIALFVPVATAQEVTPPSVRSLPPIELEESPGITELEAMIEIDVEGRARLVETDAPEEMREAIERALERAEFEPARRDGVAIPSRVRVQLEIVLPAVEEALEPEVEIGARESAHPEEEPVFGATASVRPVERSGLRLELDELREIPGAFGDPMRVVETLPGAIPVTNGLPDTFLRGAPPAGTSYSYDGIRLPGLFHLLGGPGYVHPTQIGPVVFHAGVAPARYGRRIGGVIAGEGPEEPERGEVHGEFEGRALDVNASIDIPLGDEPVLTIAGRYGYPALVVGAFVPEVSAAYWDYQLRFDAPLGDRDRLVLVVLGVYDALELTDPEEPDEPPEIVDIFFHRFEARYVRETDDWEYGFALGFGHDDSRVTEGELSASSIRFGPRVWLEWQNEHATRIAAGADFEATVGSLENFEGTGLPDPSIFGDRRFVDVESRAVTGAYFELGLEPVDELAIEAGVRADLWITGAHTEAAIEPRLQFELEVTRWFDIDGGFGLAHQPPVFHLLVPGLSQTALDAGLQRAIQSELGVGFNIPPGIRLEARGFFHAYDDLRLADIIYGELCAAGDRPPRTSAINYGAEVFAKYKLFDDRFFGWVSYTLSWVDAECEEGPSFSPPFDIRHVGNVVSVVEIADGFEVGVRVYAHSGRARSAQLDTGDTLFRDTLSPFFRLDAQVSYEWETSWGSIRISTEWYNVTLAKEATDLRCDAVTDTCEERYGPRLFYPNASMRITF